MEIEVSDVLAKQIINNLDADNLDLQAQNNNLKDENTKLYKYNAKLETEIMELKRKQDRFEAIIDENKELNKIVNELMKKDDKSFIDIKELKKENEKLKKENEKLKVKYETCMAVNEVKEGK